MYKLAMALMGLLALPATASNTAAGVEVSNIHFMPTGAVLFHTSPARVGVPACAAGEPTRWAIDSNTAAGKAQLAGLLSANATGKKVQVFGTSTCTIWGDTESVSYLRMY